ncbi:MAG: cadmium-translocating P-type ATPase [Desulfobulbaceae bacterium]|nr:MAG: cadmium-translocating P-type ATPase [Desulfobulbaceae bacterium]
MKLDRKVRIENGIERPTYQNACCVGEETKLTGCGCTGSAEACGIFPIPFQVNRQETMVQADLTSPGVPATVFRISGMDCVDCAEKLEKRISAMPGVRTASVNFGAAKLTVEHKIADSLIIQAVKQAGYKAHKVNKTDRQPLGKSIWWKNTRLLTTIVSGVVLAIAAILDWTGIANTFVIPLYALATVVGGFHSAKSGYYSLRSLSLDMNFLMTVAVIGAAAIGEWSEGAAVAFLFSFGNTLQAYTLDKTRQSIRSLMELAPPEALVRRGKEEVRLHVEEIVVGDIVIIKPGERIAMDGIVLRGISAVNQAAITGESIPVEKTTGDSVYAGTMNEHGGLEIEVTKTADNSTLARISHLVEEAQGQKAPSQQFVEVFAKYYTPLVLVAAAGIMVLPWLLFQQPFAPWFYNGLVLLVISCPCALVISTPVSIVSAIGNASRRGVLIKGGAYLEQMGTIKAVAFDKTGTLTQGRPEVTDIVATHGYTDSEILRLAASIEKWSEHPLAQAVVKRANGLELKTAIHFKALVGRGAQAQVDGQMMYIGNLRLFDELGFDLAQHEDRLADLELQGKTVILLGAQKSIYGMIAVADTLREDSRAALEALHRTGVKHISMLTGDNERVASAIAGKLELDDYYSELLPEDKVATIKKIVGKYGNVVMVGDGVNDAPALAVSTVGVAMGVAGSDVALETADVALMTDDLSKLAYIIKLSHKTLAIIKQNIAFSILIKIIFLVLLPLGLGNLWLAVFADTGASLLVTLNGMRLMRRLQ